MQPMYYNDIIMMMALLEPELIRQFRPPTRRIPPLSATPAPAVNEEFDSITPSQVPPVLPPIMMPAEGPFPANPLGATHLQPQQVPPRRLSQSKAPACGAPPPTRCP